MGGIGFPALLVLSRSVSVDAISPAVLVGDQSVPSEMAPQSFVRLSVYCGDKAAFS